MTTWVDVIEDLNELRGRYDSMQELARKLDRIRKHLEALESGAEFEEVALARLLSELIETLASGLPDGISDMVKAYAAALNSAMDGSFIDTISGCKHYNDMRERGMSHEQYNEFFPTTHDWEICRLKYNLNHLPPETDAGSGDSNIPESDWRPSYEPPEPFWKGTNAEECCENGGKDQFLTVQSNLKIIEDQADKNRFRITGSISVSHPCGIHRASFRWPGLGWPSGQVPSVAQDTTSMNYSLDIPIGQDLQISTPLEFRMHALSKCGTGFSRREGTVKRVFVDQE